MNNPFNSIGGLFVMGVIAVGVILGLDYFDVIEVINFF